MCVARTALWDIEPLLAFFPLVAGLWWHNTRQAVRQVEALTGDL